MQKFLLLWSLRITMINLSKSDKLHFDRVINLISSIQEVLMTLVFEKESTLIDQLAKTGVDLNKVNRKYEALGEKFTQLEVEYKSNHYALTLRQAEIKAHEDCINNQIRLINKQQAEIHELKTALSYYEDPIESSQSIGDDRVS